MGEKALYRSAVRSRRQIRQAFLQLLQEKELSRVTVTDIVKRADVSRSTFYAHYPDVWGVVEEYQNELIEWLVSLMNEISYRSFLAEPMPVLLRIGRMMEEKREPYRILIQSDGADAFLKRLEQIFVEWILSETSVDSGVDTFSRFAIRLGFFTGGISNLCFQWLGGSLECSAEDMAEELERLLSVLELPDGEAP